MVRFILIFLFSILNFSCNNKENVEFSSEKSQIIKGEELFIRMACNACHSVDGSLKLGPSLKNQFGMEILHTDGTVMIIDEKYIYTSLVDPLRHIVEGYTPIMPSYKPILKDDDIHNIIAYNRLTEASNT